MQIPGSHLSGVLSQAMSSMELALDVRVLLQARCLPMQPLRTYKDEAACSHDLLRVVLWAIISHSSHKSHQPRAFPEIRGRFATGLSRLESHRSF